MTMLGDVDIGSGTLRFAKDYIGVDYHNDGHTHIDALCHVAFDGLALQRQAERLGDRAGRDRRRDRGAQGRTRRTRRAARRARACAGVPWLEPGEHVFRDDLEGGRARAGRRRSREGDILLVRTGHARRLRGARAVGHGHGQGGPAPDRGAASWPSGGVAALGSDGNSDTAPSTTEGIDFPIHALALNAMGVHLLDYLQFEDLAVACERERRWEFLFVAAPLRIVGGHRIAAQPDRGPLMRRARGVSTPTSPSSTPDATTNG